MPDLPVMILTDVRLSSHLDSIAPDEATAPRSFGLDWEDIEAQDNPQQKCASISEFGP